MKTVRAYVVLGVIFSILTLFSSTSLCLELNSEVENALSGFSGVFMKLISYSANIVVVAVFILLLFCFEYFFLKKRISDSIGAMMALAFIISMAATLFLKAYIREPRPHHIYVCAGGCSFIYYLMHADAYAFPSGHAVRSALVSWFVCRRNKKLVPLMTIYVIAVCFSRIALGAHWFIDVLSGVVLGLWVSSLTEMIYKDVVSLVSRTWMSRFLRF